MKNIYTLFFGLILSVAASAQCTELFFSEYAEGSSSNKYLEVFNPTKSDIDLSDYAVLRYSNGSATGDTFIMNGMLAAGDVYVIANSNADATILGHADTTGTATFYNGDDAVALHKLSTSTTLDIIGVIGTDPGSEWTVGSGSTKEHTLVRKSTIENGETTWMTSAGEWDVYAQNEWSYAGSHSSACNATPEPTKGANDPKAAQKDVISLFSGVYTNVNVDTWRTGWSSATLEDVKVDGNDVKKYTDLNFVGIEAVGMNSIDASGMKYFTFDAWTPDATQYRIKLVDWGADNAFGGGDDTEHELAFDNPAQNTWTNHTIELEEFTGLASTMNISQIIFAGAPAGSSTLYVDNIYFSRDPILVYKASDIADVIMLDSDLSPTNLDTLYEITGVVYGSNLRPGGLSFTMIDATGGMNIFNFNDDKGYTVTEGDEITVKGKVDFYRGLLEIVPDSIKINSQGNTLAMPTMVAAPSEATESNFIQLEKVWLADTTTVWPSGNVELTNEAMDTFQMRIDSDIPGIVGEKVAYDTMTIVGIGGQFDASAPYSSGYQIFPRGLGDIMEWKNTKSVNDLNRVGVTVYPNPSNGQVRLFGSTQWDSYSVMNTLGQEVANGEVNSNTLDLSALENGYYFIEVSNKTNVGVTKVLLSK